MLITKLNTKIAKIHVFLKLVYLMFLIFYHVHSIIIAKVIKMYVLGDVLI